MNYPVYNYYTYRTHEDQDGRFFPVLPFVTGIAFGSLLYGAFHQGNYYPYPPYPPYYPPYGYGYGYNPYQGYYY